MASMFLAGMSCSAIMVAMYFNDNYLAVVFSIGTVINTGLAMKHMRGRR